MPLKKNYWRPVSPLRYPVYFSPTSKKINWKQLWWKTELFHFIIGKWLLSSWKVDAIPPYYQKYTYPEIIDGMGTRCTHALLVIGITFILWLIANESGKLCFLGKPLHLDSRWFPGNQYSIIAYPYQHRLLSNNKSRYFYRIVHFNYILSVTINSKGIIFWIIKYPPLIQRPVFTMHCICINLLSVKTWLVIVNTFNWSRYSDYIYICYCV